MVMEVVPSELAEVISVTPAIWPNCRSSGVATDDAMMSALAPGRLALTEMVGKVHLRQGRHRQHLKRNRPGKGDRHREQRGGHRPANEGRGDVHAGSASSAPPVSGWFDLCAKRCARLSKKM